MGDRLAELETVAAWLRHAGGDLPGIAQNLFGPKCIRFARFLHEPEMLVFEGGAWRVVLRAGMQRSAMRLALATALARWALFRTHGAVADVKAREADAAYVATAILVPLDALRAKRLSVAQIAEKYGVPHSAVLVRAAEVG